MRLIFAVGEYCGNINGKIPGKSGKIHKSAYCYTKLNGRNDGDSEAEDIVRTRRAITINNSFVHGLCNCSCITCNINKPTYKGPKAYQTRELVEKIVERVLEAADQGLFIRAIGNSGDGEPTMHPEFSEMMSIFGNIKRRWNYPGHPAPDICIVTNGHYLARPDIVKALVDNEISVKMSFPTCDPQHYSEIMQPLSGQSGEEIFKFLIPALENIMALAATRKIPRLEFHVSPPYLDYLRPDFPKTIDFLTTLAAKQGLKLINLKMFPVLSNRAGAVRKEEKCFDLYEDYFKKYHNKTIHGVMVNMFFSYDFFYPNFRSFFDLWKAFNFPCLWYGNIYLSPFGGSDCPNDQSIQEPDGNIMTHSLRQIMEIKENRLPGKICKPCNQKPINLYRLGLLRFFHLASHLKLQWKIRTVKNIKTESIW